MVKNFCNQENDVISKPIGLCVITSLQINALERSA